MTALAWAYHHRYDMDPARYQALVAQDQQLEARVEQLEAQQAPRDPNYAPPGVDRDLMYSDQICAADLQQPAHHRGRGCFLGACASRRRWACPASSSG